MMMEDAGGGIREARRGSWKALRVLGIIGLLAVVLVIALVAAVISRLSGGRTEPRVDLSNLGEVLRYGNLPQTFHFGGMVWQAVEPRRIGKRVPLERIGSAIGGLPVYHERGKPADPYRSLYLPLAKSGPYADVYVRCNPGG